MKNEYITHIPKEEIKEGYIRYKKRSKEYKRTALYIPGFGWVPCSKRLIDDMTTDPYELVVVHMEYEDEETGSDIWVTRTTTEIEIFNLW